MKWVPCLEGNIKSLRVQSGLIILIGGLVIGSYGHVVVLSKFLCKGAKGPGWQDDI